MHGETCSAAIIGRVQCSLRIKIDQDFTIVFLRVHSSKVLLRVELFLIGIMTEYFFLIFLKKSLLVALEKVVEFARFSPEDLLDIIGNVGIFSSFELDC